jgi:hypothetical protein
MWDKTQLNIRNGYKPVPILWRMTASLHTKENLQKLLMQNNKKGVALCVPLHDKIS